MAYVDGFVLAVPKENLAAYKEMAKKASEVWMDHGALSYVECVADDVPYGELTSFPRAVQAKDDEIVVFSPLAHEEILSITGKFVDQVAKRLSEHKVSMTLSPAACDLLSVIGFDEKYGARPLRRAVQRLVEDPLSEQLLSGLLRAGDSVVVDAIGDEVVVRIETPDRDGTVSV
jgi:uncharacterized protein YbaA (DUF1428 family)